jgi:hypothetical protein
MYSVQGYARSIPRLQRHSDVTVLQLGLLPGTNSVHTWYGTVLQWYILCYSMKPLVLVCSGTYLLVMLFMIQEKIREIDILIWYSVHPSLHSLVGCVILRAGITQVNVLICRWLLGIWHQHVCIQQHSSKSCKAGLRTSTYQVHTRYILSTY